MALLRSLQLLIVGSRTFCTVRAREILKPGSVIKINDGPHKVVKITHGKRGKGGGFVKAKLKNILSSLTFEKTFTSDELLEEVIVEKPKGAYSWFDDSTEELVFLGSDTFEEMRVLKEYVHNAGLLAPGEEYKVIKCEGKFIGVDFPNVSTCTVVSLSFETKGGFPKTAVLNTGAVIGVPEFVSVGDVVRVNSEDIEYVGR